MAYSFSQMEAWLFRSDRTLGIFTLFHTFNNFHPAFCQADCIKVVVAVVTMLHNFPIDQTSQYLFKEYIKN